MTHQQAMRNTTNPSNCTGEITLGSPGLQWTLGTCSCGVQIVLYNDGAHKENHIVAQLEPSRVYRQREGLEMAS